MNSFIKTGGTIVSSVALFLLSIQPALAAVNPCATTTGFQADQGIKGIICFALYLIKLIIPLLIAIGLVIFIYGVLVYVMNASSDDKRKEGAKFMLYGIIGLFVMVSVWGLVNVLGSTFDLDNTIPQLAQ